MAYLYDSETYCDGCGEDIGRELVKAGFRLPHPESSHQPTQYEYPYAVDDDETSDTPTNCRECGKFLRNSLTPAGIEYVIEYLLHALQVKRTNDTEMEWAQNLKEHSLEDKDQFILDCYFKKFGQQTVAKSA